MGSARRSRSRAVWRSCTGEVWAGGVRTDQVRLNLPIGIGSALSDHFSTLDLPIDAGGEVFSDCSYQQQNNGQLLVCADRRERVALDRPSWLPLAPGRYALGHVLHDFGPGQSMWLEVYARSVVRFVVGTAVDAPTARVGFPMTRMATPPRHWFALSDPQGPYASFWVDSDLEAQGWGASVEVRITPEMREGL